MQVDLSAVLEEYKTLVSKLQYELITHKLAVDILERETESQKERLFASERECSRLKQDQADPTPEPGEEA